MPKKQEEGRRYVSEGDPGAAAAFFVVAIIIAGAIIGLVGMKLTGH